MRVELHRLERGDKLPIADCFTTADGRTERPLLSGDSVAVGKYRILFHVGAYFTAAGSADGGRFLDVVPVLFRIDNADADYHVPLLVSPWAYSTYRGS